MKRKHGQSCFKIYFSKRFIFAILLVVISNFLISCNSKNTNNEPQLILPSKRQITTQKVEKGEISLKINESGRVVAPINQDLSFEVGDGYLKKVYVFQGDRVKKGDLLAEIECPELQNSLKLQEINIKLAQVEYEKLKASNASEYDLKKASLSVELENERLKVIKYKISKTRLISDIDGVVIYKNNISIGEIVNPNKVLFTIADARHYFIELTGKAASLLKIGMNVKVDYKGNEFNGKVVSAYNDKKVYSALDEVVPMVLISIDNAKDIEIGENASIIADIINKKDVIKIPRRALRNFNDNIYVYVYENGEKKQRNVEIGLSNELETEVVNGLKEGEEIIID